MDNYKEYLAEELLTESRVVCMIESLIDVH